MYLPAIPEIRVETTGNDVTYWLPVRPLGKARWFGLIFVGFSVLWVSAMGRMLSESIGRLRYTKQPGFEYILLALLLVLVLAGCIPAFYGLLAMFGQCRVMWRDGRLTVLDLVGLLRWRRRMPRAAIRKFEVKACAAGEEETGKDMVLGAMAMLMAEFEKGKPRTVAMGYPRAWLEAIATDLSARAGRSQAAPPQLEVTDPADNPPQFQDVAEQPADSKVVVQRQGADIVLEIPPVGLRKESMRLFTIACIWCFFLVGFTCIVAFGKQELPMREFWPVLLLLGVFWAVGIGLMAASINMGRRWAMVMAEDKVLTVVQSGPFGVKRRELRRGEIAAIRADPSGMAVNHVPIIELQIHPLTGKKVGLFAGRDAGELQWMATELRNALGVPAKSDNQSRASRL